MTLWLWGGFLAFVAVMLWIDLGITGRKLHRIGTREALIWTSVCIVLALGFTALVYFIYERGLLGVDPSLVLAGTTGGAHEGAPAPGEAGGAAALQFIVSWLIEYSLSLDNIFVIAVIFGYFRVPAEHQHRVLFWGILGAVLLRGVLIVAGMGLIHLFEWLTYPLGALLIFSAAKMLLVRTDNVDFESNFVVRMARKTMPIHGDYESQRFFIRMPEGSARRWAMTPLMLVLLVITVIDTIFALDSIPAVFAVTRDPFIAFTSNIFAVLGLRSLYFALAAVIDKFKYLKVSLVIVLAYVGAKMIVQHFWPIDVRVSLAVVVGVMVLGVVASIIDDRRGRRASEAPLGPEAERVARLTLRQMRRAVVLVIGVTVVLVGLVMIGPIPGPGILIVPLGLGILAAEFVWARHLLALFKAKAASLEKQAETTLMKRPRPWLIPLVFGATTSIVTGLNAFGVLKTWPTVTVGSGLLIGQVLWANGMLTRYRTYILTHPEAVRADARPPVWLVPLVLGGTVAALLAAMKLAEVNAVALVQTSAGILLGEAAWGAMWIAAWTRAVPRTKRPRRSLSKRKKSAKAAGHSH